MASVESMQQDIEELQKFEEQATRKKVKDILSIEIKKLQTQVLNRKEVLKQEQAVAVGATGGIEPDVKLTDSAKQASRRPALRPLKQLSTYGWDQSAKFMKLYVTLNGIQKIPMENITCEFSERGLKVMVSDFEGKDHQLVITRLFDEIIPGDSYHKVKTDMILVMLKKKTAEKTWAFVTQREGKTENKPPKPPAATNDPSDSLMTMLQDMYDGGDDEMKRSIQKAWHESRNKDQTGTGMGMGMDMGMGM